MRRWFDTLTSRTILLLLVGIGIVHMIDDRTQALSALLHDLKTPLMRLRLETENMADQNAADAIRSDLSEMQQMIDQTLSYLRGDRADEEVRLIVVAAILTTLVDGAGDAGLFPISFRMSPSTKNPHWSACEWQATILKS